MTLMMTAVKASVSNTTNSPSQDYPHPPDYKISQILCLEAH